MATRWAVQNGNWSDTATWDGGTLPTSADDVFADGKTVAIDQNVSVLSLRVSQRSGGTIGGVFTVAQDVTLTSSLVQTAGANPLLRVNSGTLTVLGNVRGGTTSNTTTISLAAGSNLNVAGNVEGGTATNGVAILGNGGDAAINITGNVSGGPGPGGGTFGVAGQYGTLNVVGDVSSTSLSIAISVTSPSSVTNVTGIITAEDNIAINSSGASSSVSVVGNVTASSTGGHGVRCDATANGVTIAGNMTDSPQGAVAVYSRLLRVTPTLNSRTVYYDSSATTGASVVRASLDVAGDHPVPANVRQGTSYAYNQLTGTLIMPAANVVRNGVAVDNTTGTGAVTLTDIASVVGAQIAAGVST